ncbi:MAG: hypothetical protein IJI57_11610 [Flexilinea sp.]|nr:hypothetical protein [Flexilinea sp.]
MKRLLLLIIAVLFITVPAFADSRTPYDYTDDILEDGSPIYYFRDLSLTLPASWRGRVMALQDDHRTSFYQTASYQKYQDEGNGKGGFLFRLSASVNSDFTQLPAYKYLGFSESSVLNYYLRLPTDYRAYNDPSIRAEYDAMFRQIDDVVNSAYFYPSQETRQTEPEPTPGSQASGWTLYDVRYAFEHSMLPRYFYEVPENMLDALSGKGIYSLWASVSTENGVDPTYSEDEYISHWYTASDGSTLLQIELPEPDGNTLCYRIYFVYNAENGFIGYYTMESDELMEDAGFICTWNAEREHTILGAMPVLDKNAPDYKEGLVNEASEIARLAGISKSLKSDNEIDTPDKADVALQVISCPELGFSTRADASYSWDYQEGTGISIYTEEKGRIPYAIIYQSGDLIAEPFEYIREQVTPYYQKKYGDDLVAVNEIEAYEIGGKQLPAGLYTYKLQGYLIDLLRLFDSTGDQTVAYTAKYIDAHGGETIEALDTAIRNYRAE